MAEVSSPLTSVARKRRREVIQTKRAVTAHVADAPPTPAVAPPANGSSNDEVLPPKKRKIPVTKELTTSETNDASVPSSVQVGATSVPDPTASIRAATDIKVTTPATTTSATLPTPAAPGIAAPASPTGGKNNNKKSQSKKKARTQIQYNPGVPMSKEQLAAWRREMRRMRNRESAAASRQKIRDRIECLEEEVSEWKAKYDDAMKRLTQTEQALMARQQN